MVQWEIRHLTGDKFTPAFSSLLSWSHYRALMRVDDSAARAFYEREAALKVRDSNYE